MKIKKLLSAIHSHYQENNPDVIGYVFFPSASPAEIDAAQAALGSQAPFPDELRELYMEYGALLGVWGGGVTVVPVTEIAEIHQQLLEIAADYGKPDTVGLVSSEAHTPARIPFASADGGLTFSIDLAPAQGGRSGQIVLLDLELGKIEVVADSLQEFFEKGLERLKADSP